MADHLGRDGSERRHPVEGADAGAGDDERRLSRSDRRPSRMIARPVELDGRLERRGRRCERRRRSAADSGARPEGEVDRALDLLVLEDQARRSRPPGSCRCRARRRTGRSRRPRRASAGASRPRRGRRSPNRAAAVELDLERLLEHAPRRERAVEDDPAAALGLDGSDVPLARRQVAERAGAAEVAVVAAAIAPAQRRARRRCRPVR